MSFEELFKTSKLIITEGAIVERLKSEYKLKMDPSVNHAMMIYENPKIMELIYRQYIDIAQKHELPIMIMTPTRRVNSMISNKAQRILSDSCDFLNKIKESYKDFSDKIMIGGLLGCKGDAYSGDKVLNTLEAYEFHKNQCNYFKTKNIDFLFAGIMPEIEEAKGMALAMAETKIPYIISFMIRKTGALMDGTKLADAIDTIDSQVDIKPICYMTNCIHPTNLKEALENNSQISFLKRFSGIQANASILEPEELNNCKIVKQDNFNNIINEMISLHRQYDLKILGGCCGTNENFIELLSSQLNN